MKQGGIDLLVMPPKLKGRLPLWRVCSVNWLRGLVKPRNYKGRALEVERQIVQMRPAQRRPVTAFVKRRNLQNEHRVAKAEEAVALLDGGGVGIHDLVASGKCAHEHHERGTRHVEVCDQRVDHVIG